MTIEKIKEIALKCGAEILTRNSVPALITFEWQEFEAFAKELTSEQELIAYLKMWAYQQLSSDGNVESDEGLEVCRKGEIGADGTEAIPVYTIPPFQAERIKELEAERDRYKVALETVSDALLGIAGVRRSDANFMTAIDVAQQALDKDK
jgi:hypothetical protein